MRAMLLESPRPAAAGPLRLAELPDPSPGVGEIRIRIAACAVCRTDLQICEGDLAARRLPVVPGHQVVGTIDAIGERVAGWEPGDRAGLTWLGGADGTCRFCRTARENLCEAAVFTGTAAINAIHLDGLPAMPYEDLWWERSIRSVATVTRRDAQEFLDLAARLRLTTDVEVHPLEDANVALARLAAGEVSGSAVLEVATGA